MLETLFPRSASNAYRGQGLALVLLGLLAALRLIIGLRSMFDPLAVAQGADGIPVSTFPPAAAHEVLSMTGMLGIHWVTVGALCVLVLWRYRNLVPLIFALQLAERGLRWLVVHANPGAPPNPNAPGDIVSWVILAMMVGGLALSLWQRPAISASSPG